MIRNSVPPITTESHAIAFWEEPIDPEASFVAKIKLMGLRGEDDLMQATFHQFAVMNGLGTLTNLPAQLIKAGEWLKSRIASMPNEYEVIWYAFHRDEEADQDKCAVLLRVKKKTPRAN